MQINYFAIFKDRASLFGCFGSSSRHRPSRHAREGAGELLG